MDGNANISNRLVKLKRTQKYITIQSIFNVDSDIERDSSNQKMIEQPINNTYA